jgi:hypothetical protein
MGAWPWSDGVLDGPATPFCRQWGEKFTNDEYPQEPGQDTGAHWEVLPSLTQWPRPNPRTPRADP